MSRDPSAWLGKIEPEKPRNARLWDGTAAETDITPTAEIRNAATLDDARRGAGMNPHLAHREDTRAAMVKGREDRERKARKAVPVETFVNLAEERSAKRRARARKGVATRRANALAKLLSQNTAPPETPPMPKANLNAPTPGNLRTYLLQHGPTDRATLLDAVGFRRSYKNEATARTMLNKALREIGAVSNTPRGPLRIDRPYDDPQKTNARVLASLGIGENEAGPPKPPDRDEKPVTRAPYTPTADGKIGFAIEPDDAGQPTKTVDSTPKTALNACAERSLPGIDELLEEFAEASIDLDKAIDRHAKARAAVLAAASR